jgi:hypothetical protein
MARRVSSTCPLEAVSVDGNPEFASLCVIAGIPLGVIRVFLICDCLLNNSAGLVKYGILYFYVKWNFDVDNGHWAAAAEVNKFAVLWRNCHKK